MIAGIDHVQLAAPANCEADARRFFGEVLGLEEIEKPVPLRERGGGWFRVGAQQLHVGFEARRGDRVRRRRLPAGRPPLSRARPVGEQA